MKRSYFSRIVTGFVDGDSPIEKIQLAMPPVQMDGFKIHKDKVIIHKQHNI